MDWISDFLDPDTGCVQQDQEFGFPSYSRIRTGFGFCTYWKNVTGCLLYWYSTGFKQDSDSLNLVGTGSGVDSDSKFAKQDWTRIQKNQCPHTSAAPKASVLCHFCIIARLNDRAGKQNTNGSPQPESCWTCRLACLRCTIIGWCLRSEFLKLWALYFANNYVYSGCRHWNYVCEGCT